MDTWATSSLTPQIVGRWLSDSELYHQVFPMSLRPQAHEIIRTWAFYTIVKSFHHFGALPWKEVAISGWGLAPEGTGKISKSRGGGPMAPLDMIEKYSADAVRYWAACTAFGKDSIISEEKIQMGARLVTKLWNVARFSQRFLADYRPPASPPLLSPADRWILSRTQGLVSRVTESFHDYQYVTAKNETESFLWGDLADNYLEMAKQRLYDDAHEGQAGARYALHHALLTLVKLLAPLLPHVTEEIYLGLFSTDGRQDSIHTSAWPEVDRSLVDPRAEEAGSALIAVATAVRRYKSEQNLPLGSELRTLQVAAEEPWLLEALEKALPDLTSITRAEEIGVARHLDPSLQVVLDDGAVSAALAP